MQESVGLAPQPTPDFTIENRNLTEDNADLYGVEYQSDRNVYAFNVKNQGQKPINNLIVQLYFKDCNIHSGFDPYRYTNNPIADVLGRVQMRPDFAADEVRRCYVETVIEKIEPHQKISLYFVTDANPEANVTAHRTISVPTDNGDYRELALTNTTLFLDYSYSWTFRNRGYEEGDSRGVNTTATAK